MSHSYHEAAPGYSPQQILHDGCLECATRAASDDHGLANLDTGNFRRAWQRATDWNYGRARDIAKAEMPLLAALWSVQLQFERIGLPIGDLPSGEWAGGQTT